MILFLHASPSQTAKPLYEFLSAHISVAFSCKVQSYSPETLELQEEEFWPEAQIYLCDTDGLPPPLIARLLKKEKQSLLFIGTNPAPANIPADIFCTKPLVLTVIVELLKKKMNAHVTVPLSKELHFSASQKALLWDQSPPCYLTDKEAELISLFLSKEGEELSKTFLLEQIWGYTAEIDTRTLETHIYHLRQKMNLPPTQEACKTSNIEPTEPLIETTKQGYRLFRKL